MQRLHPILNYLQQLHFNTDCLVATLFNNLPLSFASYNVSADITHIAIDIEGTVSPLAITEIGLIFGNKYIVTGAAHLLAAPPLDCKSAFLNASTYCHGLVYDYLPQRSQMRMLDFVRSHMLSYPSSIILSNEINFASSDTHDLLLLTQISNQHQLLPLGDFTQRHGRYSHMHARELKFNSSCIPNTSTFCAYNIFHSIKLKYKHKIPTTLTQQYRRNHQAHCALYDSLEVFLYFLYDL